MKITVENVRALTPRMLGDAVREEMRRLATNKFETEQYLEAMHALLELECRAVALEGAIERTRKKHG